MADETKVVRPDLINEDIPEDMSENLSEDMSDFTVETDEDEYYLPAEFFDDPEPVYDDEFIPDYEDALAAHNKRFLKKGSDINFDWGVYIYDEVIRKATEVFFSKIAPDHVKHSGKYSDEKLRIELTDYITFQINVRNQIKSDKDSEDETGKSIKVQQIKALPPSVIADAILFNHTIRCISWTGDPTDDNNAVAVYKEDEGIYTIDELAIMQLVHAFSYNASDKDFRAVYTQLMLKAPFVTPNRDPDVIFLQNGIFNYKEKKLYEFTPDIVSTYKIGVNYPLVPPESPEFVCPDGSIWTFESWLEELFPDPELSETILSILGAIVRPNVRWDKVALFYAESGSNGKGTLCELMKHLCGGTGYYSSLRIDDFQNDNKLNQLLKSVAVICDENSTNAFTGDVSRLKAVVTGDSISIDRKYKTSITFTFSGMIVECVNSLPRIGDQTESFYRRLLIVPFDKTFTGQEKKYIKSDFCSHPVLLEYVLWKVLNMPDYYELPVPFESRRMLNIYKSVNDPATMFVDEIFPELKFNKVPQTFLYELYIEWLKHWNPSAPKPSRNTVIRKFQAYVKDAYPEWTYEEGSVRINKDDNLEPDFLIWEYRLDNGRVGSVHPECRILHGTTTEGCEVQR